ncbi:cell division protein ZapA [Devosia sp. J2-20]|uniref:Cell division protein ZapA n=1 Tax=Devosia litorisediminis TaxID=2829817 RepID=A0A942E9D5_9HYPH|nr:MULTISPECIES: cell division protein ZapA [Devosia]MBS3847234.1 cell division protein ZapA [Devosia litorisediminis]WDQ99627.1 cell division protein ZapA [Devosia sp. J2-20]
MPEVNVEINGRKYRMACEEGQQKHLIGLAERFDAHVEQLKGAVGEIGDTRLTVMAGIAVVDELAEAERRIKALESEVVVLTRAGQEVAAEIEALEEKFAGKLDDAAKALEGVASVLDDTAPVPQG